MEEGKEIVVRHITEKVTGAQDSLELSTPARGGAIKVYCDFNDAEGTKLKIDKAIEARAYANKRMEE